jgi:simple sugar transport system permease protein
VIAAARRAVAGLVVPAAAVAAALALGAIAIAASGAPPLEVYRRLFAGALLTPYGIGQTIYKATPLVFGGLSVTLAARAGLFNIGAEGQLMAGAWAMAWVGYTLPAWPAPLLLPACLAAGALAGAAWAAPPAWLRARFGASEVIDTIAMNWIAVHLLGWLLRLHTAAHPALAETSRTLEVGHGARLAALSAVVPSLRGSQASAAALLALAAAGGVAWFLGRTRRGFELRAVGLGPEAARAGGIDVARWQAAALLIAGALAGLAGAGQVLGARYFYEDGMSGGAGFASIAVAFLGRARPAGVVLAALLLGAISHGGLVVNAVVPKEIVEVIEALVIVSVAIAAGLATRLAARRAARAAGARGAP